MHECFWRRQVFAYHEVIGWWHLPNLHARIPLGRTFHNLTTNSTGMRSAREYPCTRPAGRTRIIFLGDSYTAGDGVSNSQRFTDLMEARNPHLDAMNFGLNGSGTDQQLLIFSTLASAYEADAYVFCICVENIARNLYTCYPSFDLHEQHLVYRPKPYFEFSGDELALRNHPVPLEKRSRHQLGDWRCSFPYLDGLDDPYAIYAFPERPHWQTMKAILEIFIARAQGKPVLIVPLPMYDHYLEQHHPTYWQRFLELEDRPRNVFTLDLLPGFMRRTLSERRLFRFADDPHYTAAAHFVVAEEIERALREFWPTLLDTRGESSPAASDPGLLRAS